MDAFSAPQHNVSTPTNHHGIERYEQSCVVARRALVAIEQYLESVVEVPCLVFRELTPTLVNKVNNATTAKKVVRFLWKAVDLVVMTLVVLAMQQLDILVRISFAVRFGPRETGVTAASIMRRIKHALLPPSNARRVVLLLFMVVHPMYTHMSGFVRAPLDCDALMAGSKECGLLHPDLTSACIRTDDNTFVGLRDWYIKARDQDKQVVFETYANCKPTKTLRAKNIVVVSHTPTLKTYNLSGAPAYCAQLLAERSANQGKCADDP